jgi:hypothetical protein
MAAAGISPCLSEIGKATRSMIARISCEAGADAQMEVFVPRGVAQSGIGAATAAMSVFTTFRSIFTISIVIHDLDRRQFAEHSIFVFDIADLRHPCPSWFQ